MACLLDDLRAFGINADQWTIAAQNEGEWCKTAEQGVERFMAKRIAAEKVGAGLRYAVACPNVTGRIEERIAQTRRARAGSLATADQPQVARIGILRAFCLPMPCCLSLALRFSLVSFCFVFVCFVLIGSVALRSIVLRYTAYFQHAEIIPIVDVGKERRTLIGSW